jgi:hypothetical protein
MKDSGTRQQFAGGAVRDTAEGKPRLALISPQFKRRLGAWLTAGAVKYEPWNYARGIPISRCLDSLERHLAAYEMREDDEDHAAAIAANIAFIIHFEEEIKAGHLPAELDDRPDFTKMVQPTNVVPCPTTAYRPMMRSVRMYRFEFLALLNAEGLKVTRSTLEYALWKGFIPPTKYDRLGNRIYGSEHVAAAREYFARPHPRGRRPSYPPRCSNPDTENHDA